MMEGEIIPENHPNLSAVDFLGKEKIECHNQQPRLENHDLPTVGRGLEDIFSKSLQSQTNLDDSYSPQPFKSSKQLRDPFYIPSEHRRGQKYLVPNKPEKVVSTKPGFWLPIHSKDELSDGTLLRVFLRNEQVSPDTVACNKRCNIETKDLKLCLKPEDTSTFYVKTGDKLIHRPKILMDQEGNIAYFGSVAGVDDLQFKDTPVLTNIDADDMKKNLKFPHQPSVLLTTKQCLPEEPICHVLVRCTNSCSLKKRFLVLQLWNHDKKKFVEQEFALLSCLNLKRDMISYCKSNNLELELESPHKRTKQVHYPVEDSRNSIVIKNLDGNGNFEDREDIDRVNMGFEDKNEEEYVALNDPLILNDQSILNLKNQIVPQDALPATAGMNANDVLVHHSNSVVLSDQLLQQCGIVDSQNYQTHVNSTDPPYYTSELNFEQSNSQYKTSDSFQSNQKYDSQVSCTSANSHSSQTENGGASANNNVSADCDSVTFIATIPKTEAEKFKAFVYALKGRFTF